MAEIACLSTGQFHRAFKKQTGKTPFGYVEEVKMDHAFQMILLGSKKVHELSTLLGYKDYETFSRSFKKHHFVAPDDLKMIAQKIKDNEKIGPEDLIIKTFEIEDMDQVKTALEKVADKLNLLLTMKGLSKDEIENAKLLSVIPKQASKLKDPNLVKNKFVITEDKALWQQLLDHKKDGDN